MGLYMIFIVPQIIRAIVEKENLFNFLVCEVHELGMRRVHSPNRIISRKMFCMKCAWL